MEIKRIDYNSDKFRNIIKDAPTDIIIFNKNAEYYCIVINDDIVSICGILTYKNKHKIISLFTYPKYRNNGYMLILLKNIISKCKHDNFITHANENSYKLFRVLGFIQIDFRQFKNFTRRTMIFKREDETIKKWFESL